MLKYIMCHFGMQQNNRTKVHTTSIIPYSGQHAGCCCGCVSELIFSLKSFLSHDSSLTSVFSHN